MTYPSFRMFLLLLAASLPLESIAFVTTSSHGPVPALATAIITKPLRMSDAASEWYTPLASPSLQSKRPEHAVPVVTHIDSPEAFQEYLQAPDNRITVVSFHASWCKSCQKFGRLYQKLATEEADWVAGAAKDIKDSKHDKKENNADADILETGAIRLASIEWGANTEFCRSLGIKRLPSVHYYHNGRKLGGFPAGPSKFELVKDRLTYYQSLSKAELEFEANLLQGGTLVSNTIHLAAKQEEELPAKEAATASADTVSPASSSSTSTSTSNRESFINAKQYKSLWQKIFRPKAQS
jgi:thioredoxin-like negative regulator of GroEL